MISVTKACRICNAVTTVQLTEEDYDIYKKCGSKALPKLKLNKFEKEFLITGMCFDCQSRLFNTLKPDEDWGDVIKECYVCGTSLYKKDCVGSELVCPACGESYCI